MLFGNSSWVCIDEICVLLGKGFKVWVVFVKVKVVNVRVESIIFFNIG